MQHGVGQPTRVVGDLAERLAAVGPASGKIGAPPIVNLTGPIGSAPMVSSVGVRPLATMAKSLARPAMATGLRVADCPVEQLADQRLLRARSDEAPLPPLYPFHDPEAA